MNKKLSLPLLISLFLFLSVGLTAAQSGSGQKSGNKSGGTTKPNTISAPENNTTRTDTKSASPENSTIKTNTISAPENSNNKTDDASQETQANESSRYTGLTRDPLYLLRIAIDVLILGLGLGLGYLFVKWQKFGKLTMTALRKTPSGEMPSRAGEVSSSDAGSSAVPPADTESELSESSENTASADSGIRSADTLPTEALPLLQHLAKEFEVKLKYDAAKQEQIDKLYKENMDYKTGILKKFQQSLILAVIEKIDETDKSVSSFDGKEFSEENYRKLLSFFGEITGDLQDMLLQRFDVENYRSEPNTPFDAKRQKTMKTVPTDEPDKHKLIKQSLRPGYTMDGQILRAEFVEVYVKQ
ncbi:MAG: nucleotide exchange factor GrpE [Planctomycetaceae bacterium]|jgi:molecular chaperone GrpE (heat shock protein)|nr:nucleotide exchange factor GrpE [Planctomycetaceae bacterium]